MKPSLADIDQSDQSYRGVTGIEPSLIYIIAWCLVRLIISGSVQLLPAKLLSAVHPSKINIGETNIQPNTSMSLLNNDVDLGQAYRTN